jgi:L-seryl-tRNA(Ser) seleniumtransferase
MPLEVVEAMAGAARCFINLFDLQAAVGRRLAEVTSNEAAHVTNGAAAGLALAAAACMTGDDVALMHRLPLDTVGMRNEIVVHRTQRNWYDFAVRQAGAKLVEIGHTMETATWELEAAITERTAAVFYFAGDHLNRNTLPLPQVVEVAHARGIPVVVDAAAQIPPVANLWYFTVEQGADLAIFSGGKGLRGPQNSGLVVGRADLIRAIVLNGPPVQRIGRPMKVAKEAMIGLLTAVELAVARDEAAEFMTVSDIVNRWRAAWALVLPPGTELTRLEVNEAGEPIPRLVLTLGPEAPLDRASFVAELLAGEPPIEVVLRDDGCSVSFSAHLLQGDEDRVVEERVSELLDGSAAGIRRLALEVTSG